MTRQTCPVKKNHTSVQRYGNIFINVGLKGNYRIFLLEKRSEVKEWAGGKDSEQAINKHYFKGSRVAFNCSRFWFRSTVSVIVSPTLYCSRRRKRSLVESIFFPSMATMRSPS